MINSFLVTLQNSGTQPTNPSSVVGDVFWPDPVSVKTYTGDAAVGEEVLFAGETDNLARFLLAIQLLWVVEESVLADTITADDPRITYTRDQLVGQFEGQSGFEQHISSLLSDFGVIDALDFLDGDLLFTYRAALSPLDKLAAVVVFYGRRND